MKLITLFLPLLAAVAVSAATPYMDLVDEADKACAKGEWTAALNAIDAALEREPENPGNILLLSNKGMIQFNLGLDSLAVATLTEAHLRAPRSVTILSNRARVLASCGRDAEALADYAQVIRLDSLDVDAHFHHGLLALRHRDYYAARTDFDWLAQNHPDSPENNIAPATILCALG